MNDKIIVFGAHEPDTDHTQDRRQLPCSICGKPMTINVGMFISEKGGLDVAPPSNDEIDLAFAKECFVELVKAFVEGSERQAKYLKDN